MTDVIEGHATLVPCPDCKTPLVVVNGKIKGEVTFWMRDGHPVMSPHIESCSFRGKALS